MRNLSLLIAVSIATFASVEAVAATKDPKAVEIAEKLMDAMGGREAFEAHRMLAFRFAVERGGQEASSRLHIWDRFTGRYRLERDTKEGSLLRVLFDVNDKQGRVWIDDRELPAEEAAEHLESAYGAYINDTYWLLMPWKWLDPGVNLIYEGEKERDGKLYDVVLLTFEPGVGLTSGDRYWGFVSKETGLMDRWEFVLQKEDGSPGEGEPRAFLWESWEAVGESLLVSTHRSIPGDTSLAITFPFVDLSRETNDSALEPNPPPAGAPPVEATGTPPAETGATSVLVVLNKAEHTAALVDPETRKVLRKVPTGIGPHEGAMSRDGKTLYVANYGTRKAGSTLSVIDVPGGTARDVVDLGDNKRPHGIAVDPGGNVWVTTEESKSLLKLAAGTFAIEKRFETGQDVTHMVVLAPDASKAFTANIASGTVSVVLQDGTVRSVATGKGPEGIDISPDGREVWVAHREEDTLVALDAESLETLATLPTGSVPIRVKITPDGKRVLVSCAESNELVVYDRKKRKEVGRVALDAVPVGILVEPGGKRAYVANTAADKVSVIDLKSLRVVGSIEPGREPDGLAWASW